MNNLKAPTPIVSSALFGEWQRIETAPKTRQRIILWSGGHSDFGWWDDQKYHEKPKPFWKTQSSHGVYWDRENQPTHWMPEPPEPNSPNVKISEDALVERNDQAHL